MRSERAGFTLIEVMIVLAIMGMVSAGAFTVFNTQKRVYVANERALDVQEGARLVLDMIAYDARMAGFMVPKIAAVASVDGGTSGADRLCISDASYFDVPVGGGSSSLDNVGTRFAGSIVQTGSSTTSFNLNTLDIDGDGGADFAVNAGVILTNGTQSWCAQINSIGGNQLTVVADHKTPGSVLNPATGAVAVPAIVYEVGSSGLSLTRNALALSSAIEDLQVEYWIDNKTVNGEVDTDEFPIHDLNSTPSGWSIATDAVRRIQVSVISRTEIADAPPLADPNRYRRPASANRTVGGSDSFKRRRLSAGVLPRNLL